MTTKLQNLVSEAVSLDREISEQTERLKEIKAQLVDPPHASEHGQWWRSAGEGGRYDLDGAQRAVKSGVEFTSV